MDSPWVWLPLCVLFLAPFVDVRRPGRILHLDLLVLLSFGGYPAISGGEAAGLPLAYPALGYVLARLLYMGVRPRRTDDALVPHAPIAWLAVGIVLLLGVRVGINIEEAYVIDTGRSGLIGAERILEGEDLYRAGPHHDTYGPLNYLVMVPFAAVFGGDPTTADPAAAHAAAIAFDLLAVLCLLLLGTRIAGGRTGRRLGVALAYAWVAYPYTLFVLAANTNDALLAALVLLALLGLASPARRGAALAIGAGMKFASLALVPLLATEPGRRSRRLSAGFAAAFTLVFVATFVPFLPDGGVSEVYSRTLGFQFGAETRFGVWPQRPALVQLLLQAAALALGVAVAFLPAQRSLVQVAALAGAVTVAIQLAAQHWYYFYVVWFAPLAFVALFGTYRVTASAADSAAGGRDSNAPATKGNAQGRYAQVQ